MIRKQNQLHNKLKRSNSEEAKTKYIHYRKYVKLVIKRAEQAYIKSMCNDLGKHPKKFWNFVKKNNYNDCSIGVLKQNGKVFLSKW